MFGAFLATVLREVSARHQIPQQTRSLYKMTYYTRQVQWENKRTLFNMSDSGKLTSEIVYKSDFAISLQNEIELFLPILSLKYVSSHFSYTNKQ